MKYHLIAESDIGQLNQKVNLLLAQGWILHGNTIVMILPTSKAYGEGNGSVFFYQAVTTGDLVTAETPLKQISG